LDPVEGRSREVEQLIQVLLRRTKRNAILIGEAGVGKTAIVEGLAQKIASGEVPGKLAFKRVVRLDVGLLVAGTKLRGSFEERLAKILEELKQDRNTIVFIDEFHLIMGAGKGEGSLDAANMLKPAMARGDIQLIGATTLEEYRRHIEKDRALERRMGAILVEPPTPEGTLAILKTLRRRYEEHHQVRYEEKALEAMVLLAVRYLPYRFQPDSAIDLMDMAGSRAGMARRAVVSEEDVRAVVSSMTGIPGESMSHNQKERLIRLEDHLRKRVKGQEGAVRAVADAVRRAYAGLRISQGPLANFIFMGPTGVGKTELAKALAEFLFGTEAALIREDMSEYQHSFQQSRLIGAPPGYVGYDDAGSWAERVRRRPYSVVLLDEIDKAHPDVLNLLLQVLEDGRITDGQGRTIDFKNTIVLMTSNHLSGEFFSSPLGFASANTVSPEGRREGILEAFKKIFRPELLNRIEEVVLFNPLSLSVLDQILDGMLGMVAKELGPKGIRMELSPEAREFLLEKGHSPELGARPMRRAVEKHLLSPLSRELLKEKPRSRLKVKVSQDGERLVVE